MGQPAVAPYRTGMISELRRAVVNVAATHNESPAVVLRRRVVVVITLAIGATVLGFSLRLAPGESSFYWATMILAAVWTVGAFASGPLHLGGINWRGRNQRPVISGSVIGLLVGLAFVVGFPRDFRGCGGRRARP